jgi:hypothetical protein
MAVARAVVSLPKRALVLQGTLGKVFTLTWPGIVGILDSQLLCLSLALPRGAVGSIEEVAVGATADNGNRKGWHLMACHTAPEFPQATAKDAITLGVLLGAGSFGEPTPS